MLIIFFLLFYPLPRSPLICQASLSVMMSVHLSETVTHPWGWLVPDVAETEDWWSNHFFFWECLPWERAREEASSLRTSQICSCLLPMPGLWSSKTHKYPLTSGYTIKCYELCGVSSTYLKHGTCQSAWLNWNPRPGSNLTHLRTENTSPCVVKEGKKVLLQKL